MAFQDSLSCISYKPGHNPSKLFVGKSRNYQRFPALVHLVGPESLRIELAVQEFELFHHFATEVYLRAICSHGGEVLYAPEPQLLYVPQNSSEWLVAHLATSQQLSPCLPANRRTNSELERWLEARGQ